MLTIKILHVKKKIIEVNINNLDVPQERPYQCALGPFPNVISSLSCQTPTAKVSKCLIPVH
jgi:hypothetical protein